MLIVAASVLDMWDFEELELRLICLTATSNFNAHSFGKTGTTTQLTLGDRAHRLNLLRAVGVTTAGPAMAVPVWTFKYNRSIAWACTKV